MAESVLKGVCVCVFACACISIEGLLFVWRAESWKMRCKIEMNTKLQINDGNVYVFFFFECKDTFVYKLA